VSAPFQREETAGATRIVGFLSGKGGVGKTNVAANVAVAARGFGARVLLVDGDLGLANVDVLLGLSPGRSAADLIDGRCTLGDAIVEGPRGIHVLPAASARGDLAARRPEELAGLLLPLLVASERYDLVALDIGAGIGNTAIGLAACCDAAVLVTTPEPTSLADAYAALKVLRQEAPELLVEILVNSARGASEARSTHDRIDRLARRFLHVSPPFLGHLPRDTRVEDAVRRQKAVVEAFPNARASRSLVRLAERILRTRPGRRAPAPADPASGA